MSGQINFHVPQTTIYIVTCEPEVCNRGFDLNKGLNFLRYACKSGEQLIEDKWAVLYV